MPLLRWTPLVVALASFAGSTCRGQSEPAGESKPSASAEVSLPGVDLSSLTPRERRDWAAQVSELLAPCPEVPVSIAQCVQEKRPCKTCQPAAEFLVKQVQAGKPKKDREEAFQARFGANKVKTIVTGGSPELGSPDAVVTIVEWADFECPFCRLMAPLLEQLVHRFEGQVRLVYKFYPLGSHPHGEIAARAAVAAMSQGKFWEMHHLLFENQDRLEQADLERYAKQIGLDVQKFRTDMMSAETADRIAKDKKQADELGLDGTPMIFINGRNADLKLLTNTYDDLEAWVKLDIELAGKVPKPPPPKPAASGSPSAGASAGPAPTAAPSAAPSAGASAVPAAVPGK